MLVKSFKLSGRILSTRSYASGPPAGFKGNNEFVTDNKSEQLLHMLYPQNIPQPSTNRTSPSIGHRDDVQNSVDAVYPGLEVHETITRAFNVLQRSEQDARTKDLNNRDRRLREALSKLEETHFELWEKAVARPQKISTARVGKKKAQTMRIPGLFPRDLRAPTETPRNVIWNHDWKAPIE